MSNSMKGRCHMEERHGWENNIKVNDMYIYMRACTDSGLGFVGLLCSRQRTYEFSAVVGVHVTFLRVVSL